MAYIDPSTGGVLFQFLAAGFAVLSGVVLVFSRQIRAALARIGRFLRDRRRPEEEHPRVAEPLLSGNGDTDDGDD
jgi:hypothetical protein